MGIWLLEIFSKQIVLLLAPISLVIIGLIVETKFTGRISLFANAIALVVFFATFETIPTWIIWYTNAMTILGAIGLISYSLRFHLFELYYHIGKIGSSLVTGIILLYFTFV